MTQIIDLGKLRMDFKGVYDAATTYELNDIVSYGANAYVYKFATSTAGNLPTNTTYWALMTSGVQYEGAWSNATAYQAKDIVTFGPKAYIALSAHTGQDPTNATYWEVLTDGVRSTGAWSAGTAKYFPGDIVTRGGTQYITNSYHTPNATFSVDLAASKWAVFASGLRFRGAWAANTAYLKDDLVTNSLNSYVAASDFTSNATNFESEPGGLWVEFTPGTDNLPAQAGNENYLLTTDGTDPLWTDSIDLGGSATVAGTVYTGPGAAAFEASAELTNAASVTVFDNNLSEASFAQIAFHNADDTSSTDIIAYSADGDDTYGWVSMGVTGKNFGDPEFTLTAGNTAYVFYEAEENAAALGDTGNLVFATGNKGTDNAIVFAAGGFASGNEQMTIYPDENVHIEIDTASTSPTTGALTVVGGVGTQGDVNILGDVTINGALTVFGGAFESETLVSSTPLFTTGTGATNDTSDRGFLVEYKEPMASSYAFQIGNVSASVSTGTITRKSYNTVTKGITSSVATVLLDVATAHDIVVGDVCIITGLGTGFDGTVTITAKTDTTISYASATASFGTVADTDGLVRVKIPIGQTGFVYGDRIVVSDCSVAAFNGNRDFVRSIVDDVITFDLTATQASVSASGTVTVSTKTRYGGLARDFSTGKWVYFDDHLPVAGTGQELLAPSDQINFAQAGLGSAAIKIGGLEFTTSSSVVGDPNFTGNVTLSGTANVISGTFTGNGTFSDNPTFSGTPVFSGNPSFTGTPVFSGGVRVQEMIEDVVDVSHTSNVITANYNDGNIFFLTNSLSANATVNITNAPTTDGRIFTINILVTQTATGYGLNTLQIAGSPVTIKWIGGVVPTPTSSNTKIDIYAFTIMRRAGAYTAFGSATLNQ